MASTLPLPVRIAAGVIVTGLDRLRRLPQELPAVSVTVAGQVARLSMRVQQEITELAGRGDEVLSGITSRPTERPAWATFDDEAADAGSPESGGDAPGAGGSPATDGAASSDGGSVARRPSAARRPSPGGTAVSRSGGRSPAERTAATPAHDRPATGSSSPGRAAGPSGPPDLPGYDELRAAQVRARLRTLDAAAVGRLLEYERAHGARAPYLTLLSNRITTLQAEPAEGPEA